MTTQYGSTYMYMYGIAPYAQNDSIRESCSDYVASGAKRTGLNLSVTVSSFKKILDTSLWFDRRAHKHSRANPTITIKLQIAYYKTSTRGT